MMMMMMMSLVLARPNVSSGAASRGGHQAEATAGEFVQLRREAGPRAGLRGPAWRHRGREDVEVTQSLVTTFAGAFYGRFLFRVAVRLPCLILSFAARPFSPVTIPASQDAERLARCLIPSRCQ